MLHIDQAISSTPGRLLTPSGLPGKKRCSVVTLIVDSISMKIFEIFQTSTNTKETIEFKNESEKESYSQNVCFKQFRSDNVIFKSKNSTKIKMN